MHRETKRFLDALKELHPRSMNRAVLEDVVPELDRLNGLLDTPNRRLLDQMEAVNKAAQQAGFGGVQDWTSWMDVQMRQYKEAYLREAEQAAILRRVASRYLDEIMRLEAELSSTKAALHVATRKQVGEVRQ